MDMLKNCTNQTINRGQLKKVLMLWVKNLHLNEILRLCNSYVIGRIIRDVRSRKLQYYLGIYDPKLITKVFLIRTLRDLKYISYSNLLNEWILQVFKNNDIHMYKRQRKIERRVTFIVCYKGKIIRVFGSEKIQIKYVAH